MRNERWEKILNSTKRNRRYIRERSENKKAARATQYRKGV